MKDKVATPAKKKMKANFRQTRLKSDKLSDYKYDQKPSVVERATSPDRENKADADFRKLVSKRGVYPSAAPDVVDRNEKRRYK